MDSNFHCFPSSPSNGSGSLPHFGEQHLAALGSEPTADCIAASAMPMKSLTGVHKDLPRSWRHILSARRIQVCRPCVFSVAQKRVDVAHTYCIAVSTSSFFESSLRPHELSPVGLHGWEN